MKESSKPTARKESAPVKSNEYVPSFIGQYLIILLMLIIALCSDATAKEKKMIENWICTMQYGTEVIRLAYDATVDAISKPSIAYANTILERWYAEGYRTVDDVTAAMEAYRRQKLGGSSFDIDDFFEAALKNTYGEL